MAGAGALPRASDAADAILKISSVLSLALVEAFGGTTLEVMERIDSGEKVAEVLSLVPISLREHGVGGLQDGLADVQGAGYQGLLDTIIRDGSWLGWFDDRPLALTSEEPLSLA